MTHRNLDRLEPVMTAGGPPICEGARWVALIDSATPLAERVVAVGSTGYPAARLWIRAGSRVRGVLECPLREGVLSGAELGPRIASLPSGAPGRDAHTETPPVTVVVCTRRRAHLLRDALVSILASDYPDFDVVVVDNAPEDSATAPVVDDLADPRLRWVPEPMRGLSIARNAGLLAATGELVAFTDDDVIVDRGWIRALVAAFDEPAVACVAGLVPSGELRTDSQLWFERRVGWSASVHRTWFEVGNPPDDPLFPFCVGRFGTGANFAVRRRIACALGGFDEALGAGSPTGGGEDIDMFVRIVRAGHALVREPDALVWHRHRHDTASAIAQVRSYGTGLGAWLTKVSLSSETGADVLRRASGAFRQLVTTVSRGVADDPARERGLRNAELAALARGPAAYARARRAGLRAEPLHAYRSPGSDSTQRGAL